MNDISSKNNINNESPLPIRATSHYKDEFRKLSSKFSSQKLFFEALIDYYIAGETEKNREKKISFEDEIGLISYNLEKILTTFKNIATKSQDTIGSVESNYEQKLKNLNSDIETANLKYNNLLKENLALKEKADLLSEANKGYSTQSEKQLENIHLLEEKIKDIKSKNSDLMDELHELRNIEKQNIILTNEKSDLMKKIKDGNTEIESIINLKDSEIQRLAKLVDIQKSDLANSSEKISQLNLEIKQYSEKLKEYLDTTKTNTAVYIEQMKKQLSKEYDLKYKEKILELKGEINKIHTKYNDFQLKYFDLMSQNSKS